MTNRCHSAAIQYDPFYLYKLDQIHSESEHDIEDTNSHHVEPTFHDSLNREDYDMSCNPHAWLHAETHVERFALCDNEYRQHHGFAFLIHRLFDEYFDHAVHDNRYMSFSLLEHGDDEAEKILYAWICGT
tara:strand:+ start:262 stop:651 length:390 start_codon:yes stop_codon:yes gene_type:complete